MSITFAQGDIFATQGISAFAHGCNCAGAMGRGIAVTFKNRWPDMYAEYRQRCLDGAFGLGDVFLWEESGEHVFNLGTQKTWRTRASLEAIETSLRAMIRLAEDKTISEIALPAIGAGLGGLQWADVKSTMQKTGAGIPVNLLVCETFVQEQSLR